ncbi:hypothetical protein [Carboxylicivirga linearis]|uniref:Nucleoside 2-deoxyribosyltransferase n=1 Tax=Carboxylicivirga linearis TaxID=1628157 RepID=A0ABS5JV29_9BACT|nr:hypothetical protein [Carboxylicivirga linearis]MBS2098704.1 hypothetical protein [Carboxylicivirga linearis]
MGNYHIARCHITGLETKNYPSSFDLVEYTINTGGRDQFFRFHYDHVNSEFVEKNKYILYGLILNDKFPQEYCRLGNESVLTNEILERMIREANVPIFPEEKITNLMLYLHSSQDFEGAQIDLRYDYDDLSKRLYFKNNDELYFYFSTLKEQELVTLKTSITKQGKSAGIVQLTFKGLKYVVESIENGAKSKNCFIAMSFSDQSQDLRSTIKSVVSKCGYKPIIVDEIHYDSDLTINDAIIRYIKKSKFLIADFTEQKHGVYFEAGYALGLKRPVIYSCLESDFHQTHFDTNHYPHIVYKDLKELEIKLHDKIKAWID